MAQRISKGAMLDRVLQAVRASGWDCIVLSDTHPFRLSLFQGEVRQIVLCYIWNLTHGGYPRDPNELRIQVTGVDRFRIEPGAKTLVLGWSEGERMFAGFDVTRHLITMRGRSPSFQIRRETLNAAAAQAFGLQRRGNQEIAIAFRPEFLATYVNESEQLHGAAQHPDDVRVLATIAVEATEEEIPDIPAGPRRSALQQIQRKVRDQRFRKNVLTAYDYRCAMSGIQLDLLDAAHLIPVEHDRGTDETKNGICLSAIHHRAFDHGLVGIHKDYSIVVNSQRLGELKSLGWDGGIQLFKSTLRDQILLPARRDLYPDTDYLIFGQALRGWDRRSFA
jgi:putative restriction endonuclease